MMPPKLLLTNKSREVRLLAEALLDKEVLFQSDVEALIGKRPYEEKRALDVSEHEQSNGVPPAVIVPPATEEVK